MLPLNQRLQFIKQEYRDGNISEIPTISAGKNLSEKLNDFNRAVFHFATLYDDFLDSSDAGEAMQIKSYVFDNPEYIQVVVNVYAPHHNNDYEMFSINYDWAFLFPIL